ncbi:MAG: DNA primase [Lachnospiraceae bacterium]|nr:DNA primase [Lachnospiraceae bacterium]
MTVEEIKQQYTMQDILSMYGIRTNRAGFIHCPFHDGDRTASCKIYRQDFHCHACGAHGDIFTFVQQMEHCSFKDAFKRLGGSYSRKTDRERDLFRYRLNKAKESRLRREYRLRKRLVEVNKDLFVNRMVRDYSEPFSDKWCRAVDGFEKAYIEYVEIMTELRGIHNDS